MTVDKTVDKAVDEIMEQIKALTPENRARVLCLLAKLEADQYKQTAHPDSPE